LQGLDASARMVPQQEMMMVKRSWRYCAAMLLCCGLTALAVPPALAQPAIDAAGALEAWVAGLDESPELQATYESITGEGGEAVLTGLVVTGQELIIRFDAITVSGYRGIGTSGYAFSSFVAPRVDASTPTTEVSVIGFAIDNLVVPEGANPYDETQPITSILDMWGSASQVSMDRLSIDRIDIGRFDGGLNSLVTYQNFVMNGLANGRIASTSAGPLVMESPSPDALLVMTVDDLRSDDIDFGAIAWVLDPAAYADGNRDWRSMLGHAEYDNIIIAAPDFQLRVRSIQIDDFQMRQAAEPFTPVLERIWTDPDLSALEADELTQEILVDLISPWGLGKFSIEGLDIYTDEVDRFHIGDFHISDLSLDGLGEIGLADLDVVISGEGYMRIGNFAIGGLVMPDEAIIRRVLQIAAAGGEITKIEDFLPSIGYIELADFAFGQTGTLPITLDHVLIGAEGYLATLPTATSFEVRGLDVPLSLIEGDFRRLLNQIGYTELKIDLGIYADWDEATQTLKLDNIHAAVTGAGSITASIELGGFTRAMFDHIDSLSPEQLNQLTFNSAEIRVVDESVADKLFAWTAQGTDQTAAQYRNDFIVGLPFLLGLTIDRTIAATISPPIQQFLRGPSTLVVTAHPDQPVPLATVMEMASGSPFSLLSALSVELAVEPLP
jgi:hypothetical protein